MVRLPYECTIILSRVLKFEEFCGQRITIGLKNSVICASDGVAKIYDGTL